MTRAVVDTSVLISAFLFPESVPGQLIKLADQDRFALHFSIIILDELREALRRDRLRKDYDYSDEDVAVWCKALHETGILITKSLPDIAPVCRDPDDDHVIAAALSVGAQWIVTGDKDLLALGRHEGVHMITARDFMGDILAA